MLEAQNRSSRTSFCECQNVLVSCSPASKIIWKPWRLLPQELAWPATPKQTCRNTSFHCFPTIFASIIIHILWKLTREMNSLTLHEDYNFPRGKNCKFPQCCCSCLCLWVQWKLTTPAQIFGGSAFTTFYNKEKQKQAAKETHMTDCKWITHCYFLYTHKVFQHQHAPS